MRYVIRLAAILCCAFAGLLPAEARRVALVIGNADYRIGPLQNPVTDAAAVAEALEKRLKFDKVIVRRNLGHDGFRAALRELAREAVGAEFGVIYFAGHGIEVAGRNYLIPTDAKLAAARDVDLEAIALDTVLGQLDGVRKLKLVILDACRNNPFAVAGAKRSVSRGLARVEPEGHTLIAYAAKDGTTADDGKGRHSPFTAALLKRIATPGLDVRLMFGYVSDDVMAATNRVQEPYLYGRLGGAEIFLHPAAASGAAPDVPPVPPAVVRQSAVAEAWAAVKDTKSIDVLRTFRSQFGAASPVYDQLAAARIDELNKLAMQVPAPAPVAPPAKPPAAVFVPPPARPALPAFVPYHTRPVTLVVPYGAGGGTDVTARIVAEHMSRTLGQPVLVVNRPGGSGAIGTLSVAKTAAADGHTILIHGDGLSQSLAIMGQGAGAATLEPAGLIQVTPMVVLSTRGAPARDLKGLVRWMRGGSLKVGTSGVASASHLCGLHLEKTLGLTFVYIPYRGSGPALQDLGAGVLDLTCQAPAVAAGSIRGGTGRAHAVLGGKRIDAIPDVPTSGEGGVPGLEFASHTGLYVRKGTPRAAIAAVNAALHRALADTSVASRLSSLMMVPAEPHMRSPEAHARYFTEDLQHRTQLLKGAGVAR